MSVSNFKKGGMFYFIDGKLIPERYQRAMVLTDTKKRILGILGSAQDLPAAAGAGV